MTAPFLGGKVKIQTGRQKRCPTHTQAKAEKPLVTYLHISSESSDRKTDCRHTGKTKLRTMEQ
jgi:hypothetical protein